MKYFYSQMKKLIPKLNEQPLTEAALLEICEQLQAKVYDLPLENQGYYVRRGSDKFIFLKKSLGYLRRLETFSHETAHLATHEPCHFLEFRHEQEAYAFALIALIPLESLRSGSFLEENESYYAFKLWKERRRIYFLYGV